MEVRLFMLAKYAEFNPDVSVNLTGGDITGIAVPQIPAVFPLIHLVMKVAFPIEEAAQPRRLRIQFLAPEGTAVFDTNDIVTPIPKNEPDKKWFNVCLVLPLAGLPVLVEGEFKFTLWHEDAIVREIPFTIKVASATESPDVLTIPLHLEAR